MNICEKIAELCGWVSSLFRAESRRQEASSNNLGDGASITQVNRDLHIHNHNYGVQSAVPPRNSGNLLRQRSTRPREAPASLRQLDLPTLPLFPASDITYSGSSAATVSAFSPSPKLSTGRASLGHPAQNQDSKERELRSLSAKELILLANQFDPQAIYGLGKRHLGGIIDCRLDPKKGLIYIIIAADLGCPAALYKLGEYIKVDCGTRVSYDAVTNQKKISIGNKLQCLRIQSCQKKISAMKKDGTFRTKGFSFLEKSLSEVYTFTEPPEVSTVNLEPIYELILSLFTRAAESDDQVAEQRGLEGLWRYMRDPRVFDMMMSLAKQGNKHAISGLRWSAVNDNNKKALSVLIELGSAGNMPVIEEFEKLAEKSNNEKWKSIYRAIILEANRRRTSQTETGKEGKQEQGKEPTPGSGSQIRALP